MYCNESPTANIQRVLTKFVQRLVNGKATGIHNTPNKVLRYSIHLIAPVLKDIFNLSISTKIFPNDLKVLHVYKSSERENMSTNLVKERT